jgi:Squalene-hopene cyclase C-terminal domain
MLRTAAVVALVACLCWPSSLIAEEPAVTQAALRAAIEKSLPLLMKGAVGHRENRTCFACHNQGAPILALTAAKARGFAIDDEELGRQLSHTAKFLDSNRENYLQGKGQGGQADTAGYALLTLAAGGCTPDETTAAVAEYLLLRHQEKDHWQNTSNRPPSEATSFTTTYVALRGLANFGTPEQSERIAARREQVRQWLVQQPAKDNEDRVFRLLGLKAALAAPSELQAAANVLLGKQRDDGGWAQLDSGEPESATQSDAYATGSTLVALHETSRLATTDPIYERGVAYLLRTQQDNGSWHVVSRSKPFQAYFETGFPHGKDQFISSAASAWATWALVYACEK